MEKPDQPNVPRSIESMWSNTKGMYIKYIIIYFCCIRLRSERRWQSKLGKLAVTTPGLRATHSWHECDRCQSSEWPTKNDQMSKTIWQATYGHDDTWLSEITSLVTWTEVHDPGKTHARVACTNPLTRQQQQMFKTISKATYGHTDTLPSEIISVTTITNTATSVGDTVRKEFNHSKLYQRDSN